MKCNRAFPWFAAMVLALATSGAFAQSHSHDHGVGVSPTSTDTLVDGEVRKVDKEAGRVTIKHGEIKNLEMPPMTMVFRVKDPGMLDRLQPGDKIKFVAEKIGGQFTVTGFEPVR